MGMHGMYKVKQPAESQRDEKSPWQPVQGSLLGRKSPLEDQSELEKRTGVSSMDLVCSSQNLLN